MIQDQYFKDNIYSHNLTFNNIENYKCKYGCCNIIIDKKIKREPLEYILDKKITNKAGICIVDNNNRILIVQSYNNYWGIPKGSVNQNESFLDAAIRETYEETGIKIPKYLLKKADVKYINLYDENLLYCIYFVRLSNTRNFSSLSNEITGQGWINTNCIFNKSKSICKINLVTKRILKNYKKMLVLNKNFIK